MIFQQNQIERTIVGVFLAGKTLMTGKIKKGKMDKKFEKTIDNMGSEEEILKEVIHAIQEVFDEEVEGIGVGVPSLVDIHKGIVIKALNIPSWNEVHLKEILEDRFGVNVMLNNDANCFAVGEKYFGKAKNYSNIVGVILGVGLGCGIVANNHLYSGQNCGAGEIGSIPYKEFDYEYYCSENYFKVKYGENFADFLTRAKAGDKIALAIFEQYGKDFGNAIKTIMFSLDPEIIVLSGRVAQAYNYFSKSMWEKVKTFPYIQSVKKLKIELSTQSEIPLFGAAALYLDAFEKTQN